MLYPGVKESLDRFRDAGKRMAVLTNKPVRMSRHIVEGLGVGAHFFQVYGGNSFEFKKPNPIGVEALIEEAGAARESSMMVGDSSVDVYMARNAGIQCCGVTTGSSLKPWPIPLRTCSSTVCRILPTGCSPS